MKNTPLKLPTIAVSGALAASGKDPELKQLASITLPTLQDHLRMVQDLSKGKI